MNFLQKMERKIGKYAIRNLPLYIAICYGLSYVISCFVSTDWINLFSLNPYAILHGQVWRLVTWLIVPGSSGKPSIGFMFFLLIGIYFYYMIGRSLERAWGSFLFNVYFFTGCVITVIGAFILHGYLLLWGGDLLSAVRMVYESAFGACPAIYGGDWGFAAVAHQFGTLYINLSIFLAFAITYPDMSVMLFFIIPIKVKVLGIIYVVVIGLQVVAAFVFSGPTNGFIELIVVASSLCNTLLFFLLTRKWKRRTLKQAKQQREFKAKVKEVQKIQKASAVHKCEVCGQTDRDNSELQFRYCSKCVGAHEYCSEHLFTHEHRK